ncbi:MULTISPECIES: ornithine carbamoyltransferase [Calditerrivibrio]|jgi:ornithine carbamoyltransferase|uniref:Ornithine carbamoyltransferase n=1 Tax=Calditerrivibrio nitroreducens TaxID=477976 RepID=A0A2J6WN84_9BACT|nr:MAG: ornithine carbamoyltransferase [Calditerrivibrio nitroreducens]
MKKDFLTLRDYDSDTLKKLVQLAIRMKKERFTFGRDILKNKTVALIFEKSSTRTRVSFEVGVYDMGGYPLFLSKNDIQLGRGETIEDTARTLSRYVDMIMIRTFEHSKVEKLAKYSSVPVINGLTDDFHPCQVMADIMTVYERFNNYNLKLAYVGDGNNMAHSLMIGCSKFGIDFSIATPKGYEPKSEVLSYAMDVARKNGKMIHLTNDPYEAVKGADIIYTDVWTSMGQEAENEIRLKAFQGYQVNMDLLRATGKKTYFMHCLPAHRGEEVSADVIESEFSIVFDEAENRLHAQKAIMAYLIKNGEFGGLL